MSPLRSVPICTPEFLERLDKIYENDKYLDKDFGRISLEEAINENIIKDLSLSELVPVFSFTKYAEIIKK